MADTKRPAAPTTPPASATTPPPMTTDQILDAVEAQLAKLDLTTIDSHEAATWLKDFRIPLASMTTNALVGLIAAHEKGVSEAQLEELYATLTPDELNAVVAANAQTLAKIASERAREVALWRAAQNKLTTAASSIVMGALLSVLGVPAVAAITAANASKT